MAGRYKMGWRPADITWLTFKASAVLHVFPEYNTRTYITFKLDPNPRVFPPTGVSSASHSDMGLPDEFEVKPPGGPSGGPNEQVEGDFTAGEEFQSFMDNL
jgi:hypothetical protein